jgi:3-carboxy-cis,cis-muconate cycloisomerase
MPSETISSYFSEERLWQSWLDVEAALARVQAQAGILPDWAARDINKAAQLECLDLDALRSEIQRTMAPIHALSRCLAEASGKAGAWVHWGATTQNIIDTGRLLILRDVHADLVTRLSNVLLQMAGLAEAHAETAMIGRTNRQHALPITFGFKVAGWIDEMLRVYAQFEECEDRLFRLRFGGAIGSYQSLGPDGPALAVDLAKELGLRPALYAGRAQVDPLIEYVTRLGMLGVAVGRVATDLYAAMQTEIGEISEDLGHDVVGSSTMPHKVNPKIVVALIADASRLRAKGAAAFAVTPPGHEGDAVSNRELRLLVQDASLLALQVAGGLGDLFDHLEVNETAMAAHLASTRDMTSLETVMMHLAPTFGRSAAHDLLHAAAARARASSEPLLDVMMAIPEIARAIKRDSLEHLMDPQRNTSHSAEIARQLARDARARLDRRPSGVDGSASLSDAASSAFSLQRS